MLTEYALPCIDCGELTDDLAGDTPWCDSCLDKSLLEYYKEKDLTDEELREAGFNIAD